MAELLLCVPIAVLWVTDILPWYAAISIIFFIYWLPKSSIITALETFYPDVLTRNHNRQKNRPISLTFDDMPYGSHQEIIDILNEHDMRATFFVISSLINETNIEIFVEAVKKGHLLGNHGKTNSIHYLKSPNGLRAEIEDCDKVIRNIYEKAGVDYPRNMYYRPGCGLFCRAMLDVVHSLKYNLALGSVYPTDSIVRNSTVNYHYLINHIENGDIVILHDRTWTPLMLRRLMQWMKTKDLRSVTLNELFL